MPKIKITKTKVDALPFTERGQANYTDAALPGFGVYVGQSSKTYFVQRDLRGRTVKLIIGKHGVFTAEEARHEARLLLNQLARGIDPRRTREQQAAPALTLRRAWQEFKAARAIRQQTKNDYGRAIERYLSHWLDRALSEITGAMAVEEHIAQAGKHGAAMATRNMRVFRAVYNFAQIVHEELPDSPTGRLKRLRMWHRDQRRRTYIRTGDLPAWYTAVMALESDSARDYLRLVLFTGMRRSEAMRLRWERVDLQGRTLTIPTTKNGDPLVLPLSSFLHDMLKERRERFPDDEWVFSAVGARGHLQEPKKWAYKAATASGIKFGLHDLRRTFITIAESLDLSIYTLKRLLNHREGRDVTAGYIVLDVERLRRPMEQISDHLLSACRSSTSAEVSELHRLA
jgi:integrase